MTASQTDPRMTASLVRNAAIVAALDEVVRLLNTPSPFDEVMPQKRRSAIIIEGSKTSPWRWHP